MIRLSVIVAAQDAGPILRKCLAALVAQFPPADMEVLVVDGSKQASAQGLAQDFPSVRFLRLAHPTNVPRLWSAGIAAAEGSVVALTIENCVPAAGWAQAMLDAQAGDCSGVGGAIEIDPGASLLDWAIYFSRYSSYMLPFAPRFLEDIPGDNCSYKKEALAPVGDVACDGFWETFIHYEMRRRHEQLLSSPAPVVTYCGGLSSWRFFRRRYLHGRYFAARRGEAFSMGQRSIRGATCPVVALLLFKRIAGRVWRNGRHRSKFAATFPLVACFILAWSTGEGAGYLAGFSSRRVPDGD